MKKQIGFSLLVSTVLVGCVSTIEKPKTVANQWNTLPQETVDRVAAIEMPNDWRYIDDLNAYKVVRDQHRWSFQGENESVKGLSRAECISFMKDWDSHSKQGGMWTNQGKTPNTCAQVLRNYAFWGDIEPLKSVLLHWAETDAYHLRQGGFAHYFYYEGLGLTIPVFAELRHEFDLTTQQEQSLYAWFRRVLRAPLSLPRKPEGLVTCRTRIGKDHFADDCGSTRFRYTHARLLGALITKDDELFETAKADTVYELSFFDDVGVYKGMAVRGGLSWHYSADVVYYMAQLAEVYATLGENIYDFKLNESGLRLADAVRLHFSLYDDITPLLKWARNDKGNKGYSWTQLKNPPMSLPPRVRPADRGFYGNLSLRYLELYQPELISEASRYEDSKMMLQGQWGTDTKAVFVANRISQGFGGCKTDSNYYFLETYNGCVYTQSPSSWSPHGSPIVPVTNELPDISKDGCTDPHFASLFPESCKIKTN